MKRKDLQGGNRIKPLCYWPPTYRGPGVVRRVL